MFVTGLQHALLMTIGIHTALSELHGSLQTPVAASEVCGKIVMLYCRLIKSAPGGP